MENFISHREHREHREILNFFLTEENEGDRDLETFINCYSSQPTVFASLSEATQPFLDFGFFSHRDHRDTEKRTQRVFIAQFAMCNF